MIKLSLEEIGEVIMNNKTLFCEESKSNRINKLGFLDFFGCDPLVVNFCFPWNNLALENRFFLYRLTLVIF